MPRTPSPSRPPPNMVVSADASGPETGDPEMEETARWEMVSAPLPPPKEGQMENLLFVCSAVTQDISKRVVSLVSGSQEQYSSEPCITGSLPSPAGSSGLPKSTSPAHSWNQVRAVALESPLQVVTLPGCHKPGCHKPQAGFLCSSRTRRNQVSVTLHTQTPPSAVTGQTITGPGLGPCVPSRCPFAGTSEPG